MKWFAYVSGLVGALGLGALALIPGAAAILNVVAAFLAPIAKGLGELLSWIFEKLFDGMKNALDTFSAILFVATLVGGVHVYTNLYGTKRVACEQEIPKLVQQIKDLKQKCGVRCGR